MAWGYLPDRSHWRTRYNRSQQFHEDSSLQQFPDSTALTAVNFFRARTLSPVGNSLGSATEQIAAILNYRFARSGTAGQLGFPKGLEDSHLFYAHMADAILKLFIHFWGF
jgi:hypothetical protein